MLQIVTKMYFRPGVELYTRVHRDVLYTNRYFLSQEPLQLPIAELAPATGIDSVSTVTVSATEHLETELEDGTRSNHVSTGGNELIDDLADVLSFALDSVFHRDADTVRRLVVERNPDSSTTAASKIFENTFDPARFVGEDEFEGLKRFLERLLSLRRESFEAAMRAIRRIVRAMQWASADQTVSYVHLVAALESLGEGVEADPFPWRDFDSRKRRLIEPTLEGLEPDAAELVKEAILEAERAGARRRFIAIVKENLHPSYFHEEAAERKRSLRGPDLERALKTAYDVRSESVHALEELPREVVLLGERADTAYANDFGMMLSLQGLARLARHVVSNYIFSAPVGVDKDFDWRGAVPGIVQMRAAPQYWAWNAAGFNHESAAARLAACIEWMIEVAAGRLDGVSDLAEVREAIEKTIGGLAEGEAKLSMVALYALWDQITGPQGFRPASVELIATHAGLLEVPSVQAFAVFTMLGEPIEWSAEQWAELAARRRAERAGKGHQPMPPSIDAALQAEAALQSAAAGRKEEAVMLAANAVEEMPGDSQLISLESHLRDETTPELDLDALLLSTEPSSVTKAGLAT